MDKKVKEVKKILRHLNQHMLEVDKVVAGRDLRSEWERREAS